jgi:hypothetical protein
VRVLAPVGAALVLGGFFLDWFAGSAEFASRDFSGADLARLIRNFEVVASSSVESGQLRISAVVLYLVPALAINGAVLAQFAGARWARAVALCAAAAYGFAVLLAAALLAAVSWTDLQGVLGEPMPGFFVSLLGVALLAAAGWHVLGPRRSMARPR